MNSMCARRISIEREFSLTRGGKPLGAKETAHFRGLIEGRMGRIGISAVDKEVALNSIEVKFSLIGRGEYRMRLAELRNGTEQLAVENGVSVCWTNQASHRPAGHNEYFTTIAFPHLVNTFVHANSTHIHFEVSPEEALRAYSGLNAVAPYFLLLSAKNGGGMSRLEMVDAFAAEFGPLFHCPSFGRFEDYERHLSDMSRYLHERMLREGTIRKAMEQFPRMFREGQLALTPDKIFSFARIRPDLRLPNGNISVEFRPIDGIASLYAEQDIVGKAIGAFDIIINQGREAVAPHFLFGAGSAAYASA